MWKDQNMDFKSNLKYIRISKQLTQVELAKLAGLSQSNISGWEIGRSLPLPDGLIALARALECSVDYLVGLEEEDGRKLYDQKIVEKKIKVQSSFPKRLRYLRENKGLSQKDFARILGVDNRLISRLETGYNEPNLEQLETFSDFFNCSIDYLLGREDESGSIIIKSQTKSDIQAIYDDLDEVKQRMAFKYVKRLREIEFDEKQIALGSHRTKRT